MHKESQKCSCLVCRKEFSVKGIFTHTDRAHGTDEVKGKYSDGNNGQYHLFTKRAEEKRKRDILGYIENPNYCKECGCVLSFDGRIYQYCSSSCSAMATNRKRVDSGWTLSKESRKQISEKLSGRVYVEAVEIETECEWCKNKFTQIKHYTTTLKKFCSKSCRSKLNNDIRQDGISEKRAYRLDCNFNFALNDFPDEFDFTLVEQFGWYSAANRGNNLTGVSRDHMVSVDYGWRNKIPPEIISHPANCKLLRHNDNFKKGIVCSITIEELYDRIAQWDLKYNEETI